MNKSVKIKIDRLDDGYILTVNNKRKAIEVAPAVRDFVVLQLKDAMSKIDSAITNNVVIEISVKYNVPTVTTV